MTGDSGQPWPWDDDATAGQWWREPAAAPEPAAPRPSDAGSGPGPAGWPSPDADGRQVPPGYRPPARRTRRVFGVAVAVAGLIAATVAGGYAARALRADYHVAAATVAPAGPVAPGRPAGGRGTGDGTGVPRYPAGAPVARPGASPASPSATPSAAAGHTVPGDGASAPPAPVISGARGAEVPAAQVAALVDLGLVDVDAVIGGSQMEAAGTGMVLTPGGIVLTNNHIIEQASAIMVTDCGSGVSYTAKVLGYSVASDVAVLQVEGAPQLATVTPASAPARAGEQVLGIGNAGGGGGTPSFTLGTVTGTGQSVTASDDETGFAEQLSGMIATSAEIRPGDSGGPLADAYGQVVGMDTAGSASFQVGSGSAGGGYAIPVATALAIARQIVAGHPSATVHVGPTAFLGVQAGSGGAPGAVVPGATVTGVAAGSPAAEAGLARGDVITSLGSHPVTSQAALTQVLAFDEVPGEDAVVSYADPAGRQHSVTVALGSGGPPA